MKKNVVAKTSFWAKPVKNITSLKKTCSWKKKSYVNEKKISL
jgi:hypothetical protein